MFLRYKDRRKDGKQHRYWSVVENTRVAGGRVVQRHGLYLGETNGPQEAARGLRGAAARAVPGRDQRHAGAGMAAVDRGFGGWGSATADIVAVPRRPLR